jgi:hypothetical protein
LFGSHKRHIEKVAQAGTDGSWLEGVDWNNQKVGSEARNAWGMGEGEAGLGCDWDVLWLLMGSSNWTRLWEGRDGNGDVLLHGCEVILCAPSLLYSGVRLYTVDVILIV